MEDNVCGGGGETLKMEFAFNQFNLCFSFFIIISCHFFQGEKKKKKTKKKDKSENASITSDSEVCIGI
jgi:hypothetical protein